MKEILRLEKFALYNIRVIFDYKLKESTMLLNESVKEYLRS